MEKLDLENNAGSRNSAFTWAGTKLTNNNVSAAIKKIFTGTGALANKTIPEKTQLLILQLMQKKDRENLKNFTAFFNSNLYKKDKLGLALILKEKDLFINIIINLGNQITAGSKDFKDLVKMHKNKSGLTGKAWNDRAKEFANQLQKPAVTAGNAPTVNNGADLLEAAAKKLVLYDDVANDTQLTTIVSAINDPTAKAKDLYDNLIKNKTPADKISLTQQLFIHNESQVIKELIGVKLGSAAADQKSLFDILIKNATEAQLENVKFADNKNLLDKLFEDDPTKKIVHKSISYLLGQGINPTITELTTAKVKGFLQANNTSDQTWWDDTGTKFINLLTGQAQKDAFSWVLKNSKKLSDLNTRTSLFAHAIESMIADNFAALVKKNINDDDTFGFLEIVADTSKLQEVYNKVADKPKFTKQFFTIYNESVLNNSNILTDPLINFYNSKRSVLEKEFITEIVNDSGGLGFGNVNLITHLDSTDNDTIHVDLTKTDWNIGGASGLLLNIVARKIGDLTPTNNQNALEHLATETKKALSATHSEEQWQSKTKTILDYLTTTAGIDAAGAKNILKYDDSKLPAPPPPAPNPGGTGNSSGGGAAPNLASLGATHNKTWTQLLSWVDWVVKGKNSPNVDPPEDHRLESISQEINKSEDNIGYLRTLARIIPDKASSDIKNDLKPILEVALEHMNKLHNETQIKAVYDFLFIEDDTKASEFKAELEKIAKIFTDITEIHIALPKSFKKHDVNLIKKALNKELLKLVTKDTNNLTAGYEQIVKQVTKNMELLGINKNISTLKSLIFNHIKTSNKNGSISHSILTKHPDKIERFAALYNITSKVSNTKNFYDFFAKKVVFNYLASGAIQNYFDKDNKTSKTIIKAFLYSLPNNHAINYYFAQIVAQFTTTKLDVTKFKTNAGKAILHDWKNILDNNALDKHNFLRVILNEYNLPDMLNANFTDPATKTNKSMLQIAWEEMPKGAEAGGRAHGGPRLENTTILERYLAEISVKLWNQDKNTWAKKVGDLFATVDNITATNKLHIQAFLWPLVINAAVDDKDYKQDNTADIINTLHENSGSKKDVVISTFVEKLKEQISEISTKHGDNNYRGFYTPLPEVAFDLSSKRSLNLDGPKAISNLNTIFKNKSNTKLVDLFK